ncbi:glycosyltransferase [Rufibacter soli]
MKILYVIDSLGMGGAEKIVVNTILKLPADVKCTVVYLNGSTSLLPALIGVDVICLGYTGALNIFSAALKLRSIIMAHKVNIVHAHLYYSTIISRMACPANVKFYFSVHSIFSLDVFQSNRALLLIEKLTYKKNQTPIFVSNTVKSDYHKHVRIKGHNYVLYNFVEESFFLKNKLGFQVDFHRPLRLVSVGNLKSAKNYNFLIKVFKELKGNEFSLDIYGEGNCRHELEGMLMDYKVDNIQLLGAKTNIAELLGDYDVFVMSSENEGFCIAVAEAMAIGLPCILSDINTFREVSDGKAVFFDLADARALVSILNEISSYKNALLSNAKEAFMKAQDYRVERYVTELLKIYASNN